MENNEEDYEYVKAEIALRATSGDKEALGIVYDRFIGLFVDYIAMYARAYHLKLDLIPMEELINDVWCGYQKDVKGFFPR